MTRCRVGDLCIVIKDPHFNQVGAVVKIVAPGRWLTTWKVHSPLKLRGFKRILGITFTGKSNFANVPDDFLQPIRGLPKAKPTERELPVLKERVA